MRLQNEITICADAASVWRVFDDPEKTCGWQPALKSQTHVAGPPGDVGAVYELVYDDNGRELKTVTTITEKRDFEVMAVAIDSASSIAKVVNRFEPMGENQTRWVLDVEYCFKGLYKIVAIFFRRSMRARADDEMRNFKQLIECGPPEV
jgi:hypothetical protein